MKISVKEFAAPFSMKFCVRFWFPFVAFQTDELAKNLMIKNISKSGIQAFRES